MIKIGFQEKTELFVKKHHLEMKPEFIALDLVSEIGEIAKEILLMSDYGRSESKFREEIFLEIGDAFYSLINLANYYKIDLLKALDSVLQKYEKRIIGKHAKRY
ncbi:MAG: MazG-like family protein [Candidatus Parvarchaeota archaeon]|nr:MazG-like family protein [Candidatus Jingweiarchaeum tengchongense]MCW1298589.1 MazG-like family protein [Candidatus Jingweiarchaeum tengchongense]MCW1300435.1 MazG-like family protein [Candidatus Jingweiarchaeum tengchongense]MCW1304613.1 MazG-like family protein [Candidatus Jingweiarchaeum tengchongense]MCW1309332.1 MazG-like family protein [Candidatus Jingweiarchaeum tengchongense]